MKRLLLLIGILLITTACYPAQLVFTWDASATPSTPDNPIKYWFYQCSDETLTACTQTDAGTALTITVTVGAGNYWIYVTARNYDFTAVDATGNVVGTTQESAKSNIVATKVMVPPGNPKNAKVRLQ